MPRPLGPVKRVDFIGECTLNGLRACNNQPDTIKPVNLVIARTRLMHRNKYETNYAPNMPYIKNTTS